MLPSPGINRVMAGFWRRRSSYCFVLADEINRAPAKVQGAAGGDAKQVTIGDQTFKLEEPFLAATQNPIEQEGTYPCPKRRWTGSC